MTENCVQALHVMPGAHFLSLPEMPELFRYFQND